MKRAIRISLMAAAICVLTLMLFVGCGNKSGSTIDEPEITAEYLIEDYSQQLITDGGETMNGSVVMVKSNGTYSLDFAELEVVPSSYDDDGYYLANTNIYKTATLGSDARIVLLDDDVPVVSNADELIDENDDDTLYAVYFLGSSAELIIELDPEKMIVGE